MTKKERKQKTRIDLKVLIYGNQDRRRKQRLRVCGMIVQTIHKGAGGWAKKIQAATGEHELIEGAKDGIHLRPTRTEHIKDDLGYMIINT